MWFYGLWLFYRDASASVTDRVKPSDDEDEQKHTVAVTLMLLDLIALTMMLHLSGGAGESI